MRHPQKSVNDRQRLRYSLRYSLRLELAIDANHDTDDVDRAELGLAHDDRLHVRVGGLEADAVPLREVPLHRGFTLDHRDNDVAGARRRRLVHEDIVTVEDAVLRSEEHTSELQSRGLISYAVFCL